MKCELLVGGYGKPVRSLTDGKDGPHRLWINIVAIFLQYRSTKHLENAFNAGKGLKHNLLLFLQACE